MKTIIKMIFMLTFVVFNVVSIHALAYSSTNAISYSDQYANSYNSLDTLGNGYNNYDPNDCTNYVSQCLYEGGLQTNSTWYSNVIFHGDRVTREDSLAWRVANDHKNFLKNVNGATKIGSWSIYGTPAPYVTYQYVNDSNNLTNNNRGKVVLYYDWNGNGSMNHAAFFVRNNQASEHPNEGTGDLINQHSSSYNYHVLWRPDFRQTSYKLTTRVYAFQLNV